MANASNSQGKRIPDHIKQAIVAAVAQGHTKVSVAKQFKTSTQTVHAICKPVMEIANGPLSASWRERFEKLPERCVDAIESAIDDRSDTYKAAGIAQTHLKGIGIYQAEATVTNVFVNQIANLPSDWQDRYVGSVEVEATDTTICSDPVPDNGAV